MFIFKNRKAAQLRCRTTPKSAVIRSVSFQIRRLSPQEFAILAPQLVDIYIEAMGYNPTIRANRINAWKADVMRPGFTAVIAENEFGIAGLAYGFVGTPDTWWDRQLRRGFTEAGGPTPEQLDILHNYFELAEIHVTPNLQGHGLGLCLIEELAWNAPASYLLLSTPEVPNEANAAFGLYRKVGFFDVLRNLEYPADERAFAILAARLPLSAT